MLNSPAQVYHKVHTAADQEVKQVNAKHTCPNMITPLSESLGQGPGGWNSALVPKGRAGLCPQLREVSSRPLEGPDGTGFAWGRGAVDSLIM